MIRRERGDAERMIEQFMLCANEAVAKYLFYRDMPCVYRIHEPPAPEKLSAFSTFANNLGLPVNTLAAKNIYPAAFAPVMEAARKKGIEAVVSLMLLRTQTKAYYSTAPGSHFGLGIDKYCHFTSPIRRYPDLYTHRIIKSVLSGEAYQGKIDTVISGADTAARRSSENEIRAMNAERDIEDLYKCMFMFDHVGEVFDGVVSSVTSFGIFVQLGNTCEGLVPKASIDPDARFDAATFTLSAAGERYTLGMRVRVMIEDVNIITRRIAMSPVRKRAGSKIGADAPAGDLNI
ncbi:MAG: RNB domain-containing ribonuclease [Clostridia bacterium]|nr:RNB domain-containing ribonuclease [Clostridia bacterium]